MRLKTTIAFLCLLLGAAFAASAAELIIPVSGSLPGDQGSNWETELILHNAAFDPIVVTMKFFSGDGFVKSVDVALGAKQTLTLRDVVHTSFGLQSAAGAIVIEGDDLAIRKLGSAVRIFTGGTGPQFGQDVPVYQPAEALGRGDMGVLPGPADPSVARFNFGIFTLEATTVEWRVLRSDGTVAGTVQRSYEANVQLQYNGGVTTLLEQTPMAGDVIYGEILSGSAIFYGSSINRASNDPSFVPVFSTRDNFLAKLIGVDLDEDGMVDIFDRDFDGVLDFPVDVYVGTFPSFFRIVFEDPEGKPLTLSIRTDRHDVSLVDPSNGLPQWWPSFADRGKRITLTVLADDGIDVTEIELPILFR